MKLRFMLILVFCCTAAAAEQTRLMDLRNSQDEEDDGDDDEQTDEEESANQGGAFCAPGSGIRACVVDSILDEEEILVPVPGLPGVHRSVTAEFVAVGKAQVSKRGSHSESISVQSNSRVSPSIDSDKPRSTSSSSRTDSSDSDDEIPPSAFPGKTASPEFHGPHDVKSLASAVNPDQDIASDRSRQMPSVRRLSGSANITSPTSALLSSRRSSPLMNKTSHSMGTNFSMLGNKEAPPSLRSAAQSSGLVYNVSGLQTEYNSHVNISMGGTPQKGYNFVASKRRSANSASADIEASQSDGADDTQASSHYPHASKSRSLSNLVNIMPQLTSPTDDNQRSHSVGDKASNSTDSNGESPRRESQASSSSMLGFSNALKGGVGKVMQFATSSLKAAASSSSPSSSSTKSSVCIHVFNSYNRKLLYIRIVHSWKLGLGSIKEEESRP
jgi:hypothetical protein